MEMNKASAENARGPVIASVVPGMPQERWQAAGLKAKRPAAALPGLSSDSSPVSGLSSGLSSKAPNPNGPGASVSSKVAQLGAETPVPSGKRHCSAAVRIGAYAKFAADGAKPGNLVRAESEITTEGAVLDPACPDASENDDAMHASRRAFPCAAIGASRDSAIDAADSGEVDHLGAAASAKPLGMPLPSKPAAAATDAKDGAGKGKGAGHESPSESAAVEGEGADDQQGAEGTSASTGQGKGSPPGKRKVKVDWTPELHRRFVQAVEQLGVEKAIPSRILELMGVKCLTRHNIASHLQKYRSHRRHLAAREAEAANWQQQRKAADSPMWPVPKPAGPFAWCPFPGTPVPAGAAPGGFVSSAPGGAAGPVPGRPVVGMPPVPGMVQGLPTLAGPMVPAPMGQPQPGTASAQGMPAVGMPLHVWGHPAIDQSQPSMWQRPGGAFPMAAPTWFGPDGSPWPYPTPYTASPAVDMWGQPAMVTPGSMVPGTPCFPPRMMHPMGPRVPTGIVCGAPMPAMFQPGTPSGGTSAPHLKKAHPQDSGSTGTAPASSSPVEEDNEVEGQNPESELDVLGLDSFLNDEAMFGMAEEDSFNAGLGDGTDLPELEASGFLDAAITQALANPCTPLPLGLKPPSVDGVLEELNKQGLMMPPPLPRLPHTTTTTPLHLVL